jgi:very-short-patch-repair endonuclease
VCDFESAGGNKGRPRRSLRPPQQRQSRGKRGCLARGQGLRSYEALSLNKKFMAKVSTKAMTPDELRAWRSEMGKRGGAVRAKQFTSASQRAARRKVSREACQANGRKGAERTIALHGYKALFEGARRKRLANPSKTELVMMGLLKTIGLPYEREYVLGGTLYTLDFYVAEHRLGIEVDGSIHDKGKPDEAKRIQHTQRKAALCRAMKIKLIRVHHTELADDELADAIAKIRGITGVSRGSGDEAGNEPATGVPPVYGTDALPDDADDVAYGLAGPGLQVGLFGREGVHRN